MAKIKHPLEIELTYQLPCSPGDRPLGICGFTRGQPSKDEYALLSSGADVVELDTRRYRKVSDIAMLQNLPTVSDKIIPVRLLKYRLEK